MKRKTLYTAILFTMLLLFMGNAISAQTEETEDADILIGEQIKSDEVKTLEKKLKDYIKDNAKEIFPEFDPSKIIDSATKGKIEFSLNGIIKAILKYLFKEIYLNINIFIKLIFLCFLSSILTNIKSSFLSEGVGEIAFFACYIIIMSLVVTSFSSIITMTGEIIDQMVLIMYASLPAFVAFLISGGNLVSASLLKPSVLLIVHVSTVLIRNGLVPLVYFSMVLNMINNISERIQISRLAAFIKQISIWSLGGLLTVFIGYITIQGTLGAAVDGVTGKTAKFAITSFIPVVGKYLAEAADTVVGCTLIIKNAMGVATMISIIVICAVPLIKIFAFILMYRLTAAFVEPICEKRITKCLNDIADLLILLLGILASVAFMFLVAITVVISAGNISTMIR